MKKQLMIAAVAASMSLSAMADISISGTSSVTFTSTGGATTSALAADATIVGTGGGATVTTALDLTDGTVAAGDTSIAMNVMGVDVTHDGTTLTAGMTMGAYTVSYSDGATSSVTVAIDMGGMSASHKMPNTGDSTTSVSGSLGGITVAYAKSGAKTNMSMSGAMGGITGAYSDTGFASDTDDLGTVASATMDMGGNAITLKRHANTGGTLGTVTSASVATALSGGATATATWSNNGSADTLKLAVAVTF